MRAKVPVHRPIERKQKLSSLGVLSTAFASSSWAPRIGSHVHAEMKEMHVEVTRPTPSHSCAAKEGCVDPDARSSSSGVSNGQR